MLNPSSTKYLHPWETDSVEGLILPQLESEPNICITCTFNDKLNRWVPVLCNCYIDIIFHTCMPDDKHYLSILFVVLFLQTWLG